MLTCPNCHHVLAASSCCGVTIPTAHQLCPPSPAPSHHLHVSSTPSSTSASTSCATSSVCGGGGGGDGSRGINSTAGNLLGPPLLGSSLGPSPLNVSNPMQPQPLATPHISGHMFHFPTGHMHSVPACHHGACHMSCHAAVHSPCMASCHAACTASTTTNPWHWPDSAGHVLGHSLTTRMHTSGGGIVDDSISAKVMPPDIARRLNGIRDWTVWDDERVLGNMRRVLAESGWYWERLSWRQAETLLQSTTVGTFIVRESADTRFLYSLSVQTERGPTSVRIHYTAGKFRLDCESHMTSTIPEFSSIITLIEYYIQVSQKLQRHVWVDTQGKMYSPITIRQPLLRSVPTLKHLSRLAINLSLPRSCSSVRLPAALSQYIDEYPYWC